MNATQPIGTGRAFTDESGRDWRLRITCDDAIAIWERTNVDIGNREQMLVELSVLPKLLAVLWVLVEPQAKPRELDEAAFRRGLAGQSLYAAMRAFWESVADFTPNAAEAALIRRAAATLDQAVEEAAAKLEAMSDVAFEAMLKAGASGMPSGGTPESSESTQADGPRESSSLQPDPDSTPTTTGQPES